MNKGRPSDCNLLFLSSLTFTFHHYPLRSSDETSCAEICNYWMPAATFFWLDAAWLNVTVVRAVALLSATNGWKSRKNIGCKFQVKQHIQKQKRNNTNHVAVSQRVRVAGKGGLFLGRMDQGLIGDAESTHVDRPKGKAACSKGWEVLQS